MRTRLALPLPLVELSEERREAAPVSAAVVVEGDVVESVEEAVETMLVLRLPSLFCKRG